MNKAGHIISIIGGVLAILFSVLLVVTGPALYAGDEVRHFIAANEDDLGPMWVHLGEYYGAKGFLQSDLNDYMDDYRDALQRVDANDLEDMAGTYDMDAFHDMAGIYADIEAYLPKLETGVAACLIASVVALVGAQIAKRYRTAGGVMVLCGGALTLVFSLVASSIVPMALASLLLILGGLLQMARPREYKGSYTAGQPGGAAAMRKTAFVFGYMGGILALIFSLFMIYTVPLHIAEDTLADIHDHMTNENVIAFNEMALVAREEPIADHSERGLLAFADEVAQNSPVLNDAGVYEETMRFVYRACLFALMSAVIVAITILAALTAFIGALVCRKAPTCGGVMMLLAAFIMLLSSIYTGTLMPMIIAVVLLMVAGVVIFIPRRMKVQPVSDGLPHARSYTYGYQWGNHPAQYMPPYDIAGRAEVPAGPEAQKPDEPQSESPACGEEEHTES